MLAVRLGADLAAAAPFYGDPPAPEDIPKIKAAILVHHGELDTRLAATWPAYDKALGEANVPHEGYIYAYLRWSRTWLQLRRDAGTV
jgi:carboxymethylenebutenolidase